VADRWFYARGEGKKGPYSGQQLKDLAGTGDVLPTDTVWKDGVEKGALASRVKHLFAAQPPVAPVVAAEPELIPLTPFVPAPPAEVVAAAPPAPPKQQARKGVAVAVSGAVIVGQDGVNVKYKKKCTTCGHADGSWHTAPIRNGPIKSIFYCRKCRKSRQVELKGSLS
jgi:hypothetical protein